jgi:hypothetical protein
MDKFSPLLTRMVEVANHYILIDQVMEVLNQKMLCRSDPQVNHIRLNLKSVFSLLGVGLVARPHSA